MMMSRVRIRPATGADAAFLTELAGRLGEGGLPRWRSREWLLAFNRKSMEEATARVDRRPDRGEAVLIADLAGEGRPARPVGGIHVKSESTALGPEPQAYVSVLVVVARHARRGVGRALLGAAEDWARRHGYKHLALEVFAANEVARAFYSRLGFLEETLKLVKPL
jgi:GNAT superfamily N-acetyltransferase